MNELIPLGNPVVLFCDFSDPTGPQNPTTVRLLVKKPDGTLLTFETIDLVNPTVGRWEREVTPDQAGRWRFRYEGEGAMVAAEEGEFRVKQRRVV